MQDAKLNTLPEDAAQETAAVVRAFAIKTIAVRAVSVRTMTQNVPSPCVSVCRMNTDSGLCEGCFRTLDEIRAWSKSDDADKLHMWGMLSERLRQTHPTAFDPVSA